MAFFRVLIISLLLYPLIIDANITEKKNKSFLKNNLDYTTIDDFFSASLCWTRELIFVVMDHFFLILQGFEKGQGSLVWFWVTTDHTAPASEG